MMKIKKFNRKMEDKIRSKIEHKTIHSINLMKMKKNYKNSSNNNKCNNN